MYIPSTIYDKKEIPTMWRNNNDFKDESGFAPKINEVFLQVFAEPWMTFSYIKSENLLERNIALINTQETLNFLLLVGKGEKINRILINPCSLKNEKHERIFPMLSLENIDTIDNFVKAVSGAEICPVCYNKESFMKNNDIEETVKILSYS